MRLPRPVRLKCVCRWLCAETSPQDHLGSSEFGRVGGQVVATSGIEAFGIATTFVLAVVGLIISVRNDRQQSRHEQSVSAMQAEQLAINKRLAEITVREHEFEKETSLTASLRFKLRSKGYPRMFDLITTNVGRHDANDLVVRGDNDLGTWERLVRYETVAAGETKNFAFSNSDWQVLGGQSLRLRFMWSDGAGDHESATTATT
jgi:hypothetical protein